LAFFWGGTLLVPLFFLCGFGDFVGLGGLVLEEA